MLLVCRCKYQIQNVSDTNMLNLFEVLILLEGHYPVSMSVYALNISI